MRIEYTTSQNNNNNFNEITMQKNNSKWSKETNKKRNAVLVSIVYGYLS